MAIHTTQFYRIYPILEAYAKAHETDDADATTWATLYAARYLERCDALYDAVAAGLAEYDRFVSLRDEINRDTARAMTDAGRE